MIGKLFSYWRQYRKKKSLQILIANGLRIGRNASIHEGVFFDPSHCFLISVGDNCSLAPNVRLIAHDASPKKLIPLARLGRIRIEDHSYIGDSSIVLPGVRIGPYSIVGAGSVVTKDVPPRTVVAGNPARVICTFDEFIERHRKQANEGRVFGYNEYDINRITPERKAEMIEFLEKNVGYMGRKSSF